MLKQENSHNISPLSDGMIVIDSEIAQCIGFTSDKFLPMSYLWGKGTNIIISFIASKEQGKGYFRSLVDRIHLLGYRVLIPTPLPQMEAILQKWGWVEEPIWDDMFEDYVHLWHKAE